MKSVVIAPLFVLLVACSGSTPATNAEPTPHPEYFDAAIPISLQDIFREPERAVFYTVITEVDITRLQDAELEQLPRLHDWYVFDQADLPLTEAATLTDSFEAAVVYGEFNGMLCFEPHHVLRLMKGQRTLDLVICFKCRNFEIRPEGGRNNILFSTAAGMEETWRAIVRKHGLRDNSEKGD